MYVCSFSGSPLRKVMPGSFWYHMGIILLSTSAIWSNIWLWIRLNTVNKLTRIKQEIQLKLSTSIEKKQCICEAPKRDFDVYWRIMKASANITKKYFFPCLIVTLFCLFMLFFLCFRGGIFIYWRKFIKNRNFCVKLLINNKNNQ